MTRRVVEHLRRTNENDYLKVITIYEPEANKETVKAENPYSKKHQVLVSNNKKIQLCELRHSYTIF